MLMIYDQPELIEKCIEAFTQRTLETIEAINDLPYQLYYIGDDLSDNSGPMFSPNFIDKYWAPQYQRIIQAAHDSGRPIICHCCGAQKPVIPYWLKWNVEACHPLQASANDIYAFKKKNGDRIVPVGNISIDLLSFGTTDQVCEDTRRHIEELSKDGGYVVCSDHSIIDSVKPENFMAMIEAAHEFGKYK